MLAESVAQPPDNVLAAAKQRIRIGPAPDWTVPCSFRLDFKPKQPGHVTHLLSCQQIHAEERQTYVHTAIRLETTQALQNEAQGRIAFEPRTQNFILHWLKIYRGETVLDRTALENLRCVQKETDGFVAPSRLTLVLWLEGVRPGDVVELCYTLEEESPLLDEDCGCFFALPEGSPLGKLYFSLRFDDDREFRWKSSSPDLQPVETNQDGEIQWVWARDNLPGIRAEENTPGWHITYPWIQVSDTPDWESVSEAFAEAWAVDKAEADLAAIMPEIAGGGILQQTEKAIQLVQDQWRYLALDGELDEQPPSAPAVVAQRRYGDCKDLSLLLMAVLKKLGLEARLILVNTKLRKSVADLLPMPSLFDHLVVEYKARGQTRWVDATAKGQGGGSLHRLIGDFGVGLPVVLSGSDLVEAPAPETESNIYQINESVLLDTAGGASIFGIVVTAKGSHAEDLRREFESQGVEAVARRRLQMCVDRFIDVKRAGPLEYRDNRTDNEFFLAEIFEIRNFLKEDAQSSWSKLEFAAEAVASLLPLPASVVRHSPLALPYPCHMVHVLEVYCVALPPAIVQQRTIDNPWLQFTRTRKTLAGNWTVTTTLSTLSDAIPPDGIDEYREAVRELREQSSWTLQVPSGQSRPHQRSDFGRLPVSWEAPASAVPRVDKAAVAPRAVAPVPVIRSQTLPQGAAPAKGRIEIAPDGTRVEIRYRRRKRHRRRSREARKAIIWQAAAGCVVVVVLLVLAILFFQKTAPHLSPPNLPDELMQKPP
jgi:hypothetical protein